MKGNLSTYKNEAKLGCHYHDVANLGIVSNAEGDACEEREELYDSHVEDNAVRLTYWSRILLPPSLEDHIEGDDEEREEDKQVGCAESSENIVARMNIKALEKNGVWKAGHV